MSEPLQPGLYVIATPIGHPEDLSPRAAACLAAADVIAAEDTRIARTLLKRLGVSKPLISYHDHNEEARVESLMERLNAGERVALISDQGTPLLSDPGYRLINAVIGADVPVIAVPGPSALLAALVVSGLPCERFLSLGFPPRRGGRRRALFEALQVRPETLVFFEAKTRIVACLEDAAAALGERSIAVARNLTKPRERIQRGALSQVLEQLRDEDPLRGEFTVVIAGSDEQTPTQNESRSAELIGALTDAGLSKRAIRDVLVRVEGLASREAYARIHRVLEDEPSDS